MYKWRIVLGGLASASFLGTFAAGPALASTASPDPIPVVVSSAALPKAAQLIPAALGAAWGLPLPGTVTQPVSGVLAALRTASVPADDTPDPTGVVPAVGAATGALLNGLGNAAGGMTGSLLPAVGPAVGGLTAPVDGLAQDLANLLGLPGAGALLGG